MDSDMIFALLIIYVWFLDRVTVNIWQGSLQPSDMQLVTVPTMQICGWSIRTALFSLFSLLINSLQLYHVEFSFHFQYGFSAILTCQIRVGSEWLSISGQIFSFFFCRLIMLHTATCQHGICLCYIWLCITLCILIAAEEFHCIELFKTGFSSSNKKPTNFDVMLHLLCADAPWNLLVNLRWIPSYQNAEVQRKHWWWLDVYLREVAT